MNTMMVTEQNAEFYLTVMKKQMYEKHPRCFLRLNLHFAKYMKEMSVQVHLLIQFLYK